MSLENLDESFDIFNLSENLIIDENYETAEDKIFEDGNAETQSGKRCISE